MILKQLPLYFQAFSHPFRAVVCYILILSWVTFMQSRFFESIILSGTGLSVGVINDAIRPSYSKEMQGMAVSKMFTDTGSFMNPEIHKKYILHYPDLDLV